VRLDATRFGVTGLLLLLGAALACTDGSPSPEPVPGTAGSSASSAGSTSSGGSNSSAGSNSSGGSNSSAGDASAGNSSGGVGATAAGNGGGGAPAAGDGVGSSNPSAGAAGSTEGGTAGTAGDANGYDASVLGDQPVAFWALNRAPMSETDLTGNGHDGSYQGLGAPPLAQLPNGDSAADFDGAQQYLTVPSSAVFSIPTTGTLTWEAWLRPDVLQFPHDDGVSGYVDWLGKCESYGPTCEWEARMYDTNTQESPNRPNRISAYVFNPSAGLGSAADWQPSAGLIMAGTWYHVVGTYSILTQPADCTNTAAAPGSIDIWVNGVKWDHGAHGQTGCMSQYSVVPKANGSALNIATMAKESFFRGAIGKVAIYDHPLSQAQITNHYALMTGKQPTGSCAATCNF
jgi:hypothetical protein